MFTYETPWKCTLGIECLNEKAREKGANINNPDYRGLSFAAKDGCVEAVRLLLEKGEDINLTRQLGENSGRRFHLQSISKRGKG
jgi:ankyrin repeat protein